MTGRKWEMFILACISKVQFIMVGKSWQQELEATGHMVSKVNKEKGMIIQFISYPVSDKLSSSLLFIQPRAYCRPQLSCVFFSLLSLGNSSQF